MKEQDKNPQEQPNKEKLGKIPKKFQSDNSKDDSKSWKKNRCTDTDTRNV